MIRNKREALARAQELWGPYGFCVKEKNPPDAKKRYQVGAACMIDGKPEAAIFGFGRTSWDAAFRDAALAIPFHQQRRQEAIQALLTALEAHQKEKNNG